MGPPHLSYIGTRFQYERVWPCKSIKVKKEQEYNTRVYAAPPNANAFATRTLLREDLEVAAPADRLKCVPGHRAEALQHLLMLAALAAEEGNGLRIVVHAHEAVPKVGLRLIPLEVEADETASNEHGDKRAHPRVEQQPDHESTRDAPEHTGKPRQRDYGVDDDEQVPEDVRGEPLHILANTLIRVINQLGAAQAVVDAVSEVALDQMFRHPLPPRQRQPIRRVAVKHHDRDCQDTGAKVSPQVVVEGHYVAVHQRSREVARGIANKHLQSADGEAQDQQRTELPARGSLTWGPQKPTPEADEALDDS